MGLNSWYRDVRDEVLGAAGPTGRRVHGAGAIRTPASELLRAGAVQGAAVAVMVLTFAGNAAPITNAVGIFGIAVSSADGAGTSVATASARAPEFSLAVQAAIARWPADEERRQKVINSLFGDAEFDPGLADFDIPLDS